MIAYTTTGADEIAVGVMRDDSGLEDPAWVVAIIFAVSFVLFALKEYI